MRCPSLWLISFGLELCTVLVFGRSVLDLSCHCLSLGLIAVLDSSCALFSFSFLFLCFLGVSTLSALDYVVLCLGLGLCGIVLVLGCASFYFQFWVVLGLRIAVVHYCSPGLCTVAVLGYTLF